MSFNESLTISILGDSSGLRRELERVLDSFDDLEDRLSASGGAARELANSFNRLSAATRPIQQVSTQLSQLSQQIRGISNQSISINVQPALQSPQQLLAMIRQVAAALQALSALGSLGGGPGLPGGGGGTGRSPRQYAGGGLVTGPTGIDGVPARLTAGEFVLNREAVAALGLSFVDQLNSGLGGPSPSGGASGEQRRSASAVSEPSNRFVADMLDRRHTNIAIVQSEQEPGTARRPEQSRDADIRESRFRSPPSVHSVGEPAPTVNSFGGIEIHVREAVDVSHLMDDFRKQGISSRNRRG